MTSSLSSAQKAQLRAIAAEAPPAIRRRLNEWLLDVSLGKTRTLDAFTPTMETGEVAS